MQQMNSPKQLLLSQVMTVMFAAGLAFLPRKYYLLLVLAYFLVFPLIMGKLNPRPGSKGVDPAELEKGAILYEEKDVKPVMMGDTKLAEELQEQMRGMTYTFLSMPVVLAWFWLYEALLYSDVETALGGGAQGRFLSTLILFEGSFIINRVILYVMRNRMKGVSVTVMPNSYRVTSKGIISKSVGSRLVIAFPLKDYELYMDPRRKFVELVPRMEEHRSRGKIRLYARDPYKLYGILQRYSGDRGEKKD